MGFDAPRPKEHDRAWSPEAAAAGTARSHTPKSDFRW